MSIRVVQISVPAPHMVGAGGPEWAWRGVFGDGVRLVGVPAGEDAPASVALRVAEDVEPFHEAAVYLDG